jgi:hypothetical protein
MTSDSGLSSQDTDYARYIQEVLSELHQMQQTPRLVTSPEELELEQREHEESRSLWFRLEGIAARSVRRLTCRLMKARAATLQCVAVSPSSLRRAPWPCSTDASVREPVKASGHRRAPASFAPARGGAPQHPCGTPAQWRKRKVRMPSTARAVIIAPQSMCSWGIVRLPPVRCGAPTLSLSLSVPRLRRALTLPPPPWLCQPTAGARAHPWR